MTQDEIIDMARQAGLPEAIIEMTPIAFVAFAKLVADKKHQELYRLAEEAPVRGDARETRQNILHAIRGEA
jgi:hypothetical protein